MLLLETSLVSENFFLISFIILVSMVIIVISCIQLKRSCPGLCPDNDFKDLDENEDGYFNDISIATLPHVTFPTHPSLSNSAYTNNNPVYFEPLPNIAAKNKTKKKYSNKLLLHALKPCISLIDEQEQMNEDEVGENLKNLIENNRDEYGRSKLQYIKELGVTKNIKVLQGEAIDLQPGKKKVQVVVVMVREECEDEQRYLYFKQASLLRHLEHKNLLKFLKVLTDSSPYLFIYESLKTGDLKTYVKSHRGEMKKLLSDGTVMNMICDISAGLQYLHRNNIIHKDLALRNCLLTSEMIIKIGDYFLSQQKFPDDYYYNNKEDKEEDLGIPIRWMAPESLSFSIYNEVIVKEISKEANIWSLGVLIWELLKMGETPYNDLSNDYVIRMVVKEKEVKLPRPLVAMENINYLFELMEMCWNYHLECRPTIRELKIMALHLATSAENKKDFDEKWNQLKPMLSAPLSPINPEEPNIFENTTINSHNNNLSNNGNQGNNINNKTLSSNTQNDLFYSPSSDVNHLSLAEEFNISFQSPSNGSCSNNKLSYNYDKDVKIIEDDYNFNFEKKKTMEKGEENNRDSLLTSSVYTGNNTNNNSQNTSDHTNNLTNNIHNPPQNMTSTPHFESNSNLVINSFKKNNNEVKEEKNTISNNSNNNNNDIISSLAITPSSTNNPTSLVALDDNSLMNISKYHNYLQTVPTNLSFEDSQFDQTKQPV